MESITLLPASATMSLLPLSKSTKSSSSPFISHFRRRSSAPPPCLISRAREFGDLNRFRSISPTNSSGAPYFWPVQKELRIVSGSATAGDDASALSSDVIILHVGGMKCEGCTSSVKKILESQPQVSSATVNLTNGTAIISPVSEPKAVADWQKQLGEELAKHLTSCGFESNFQGLGAPTGGEIPS